MTTALAESHYDAVVVGLGAWGSAALYHLARRGLHVLGVDRFRPPHRRGSHHGQGRIIRRASFESARNTGLVARSYQLWEDLQAGLGAPPRPRARMFRLCVWRLRAPRPPSRCCTAGEG